MSGITVDLKNHPVVQVRWNALGMPQINITSSHTTMIVVFVGIIYTINEL